MGNGVALFLILTGPVIIQSSAKRFAKLIKLVQRATVSLRVKLNGHKTAESIRATIIVVNCPLANPSVAGR